MPTKNYPIRGRSYTYLEITKLDLDDSPNLRFRHDAIAGCIQNAHLMEDEMLSVPGLAQSRWVFLRTTNEWIPIFDFDTNCGQPLPDTFLDLELETRCWKEEEDLDRWWATPIGYPRNQWTGVSSEF